VAGRHYLSRTIPVLIKPGRPAPLRVGRPVPNLGGIAVPPADASPPPALELWCFLFYTWNLADPNDFASIAGAVMQKGYNWNVWRVVLREMCTARGGDPDAEIVETVSTVQLFGLSNLDLARTCKVAVFGHSAPKEHIQYVRANSTAPGGTECYTGLQNFESVNQGPEFNPILEAERLIGRTYATGSAATSGCNSDGKNRYGCTCIDQFERQDSGVSQAQWPCGGTVAYPAGIVACPHTPAHGSLPPNATVFTKHVWDTLVATEHVGITDELVQSMEARLEAHYVESGKYVLHGCLYDNMRMGRTFSIPDGPTNLHITAEADHDLYNAGWRYFSAAVGTWANSNAKVLVPSKFFWANCSDLTTVYTASDVRNRWVEFFFVKTDGSGSRLWAGANGIQEALQRAKADDLRIVLGITGSFTAQHIWATTAAGPNPGTNGTWAQIHDEVEALDAWGNVYVQCARQTSGGYIFWQEGWREPLAVAA